MIEVTIFEGTNGDPINRVYFKDTQGRNIRESFYNQLNQPVIEEMLEYDDESKFSRYVLFIGNEHKAVAYRNLYQTGESQRSDKRSGYTDYKLIDGEFKKISRMIYEPSSQERPSSKSLYYNQNDEMLYYSISDDNTFTTTYFDPNDQMIEDFYTLSKGNADLVETYDTIKSELLKQARDKYYDNK